MTDMMIEQGNWIKRANEAMVRLMARHPGCRSVFPPTLADYMLYGEIEPSIAAVMIVTRRAAEEDWLSIRDIMSVR